MIRERNVTKSVLFKLIKSKRPFGLMGIIFLSLSVFVVLPLIILISTLASKPYEEYDFDAIRKNGVAAEARITRIEPVTNVTVNGQNPVLIDYEYRDSDKIVSDSFQTFDLQNAATLKPGDTIAIKAYNGESVIAAMEPYAFPVHLFLLMPVPFFFAGLILFLVALFPALKKYKLYKTGIVKDAEIISMAPTGFGVRGMHRQSLLVQYFFTGRNGQKVFSESVTDEYSLLHEKKSGDAIKIFVSEDDEAKSCLVPKLETLKYNWNI